MALGGPTARTVVPLAAAVLLLVLLSALRLLVPDADGLMLFATVPIAALGMMLGVRAGLAAALFASAVVLAWAASNGESNLLDYVNEPLTFFLLGGISGHYAHGALGDYDLRRAAGLRELRRGMGRGELRLDFQPIYRSDRSLLALEALARWTHPQRGGIPPGEFIPLAESDEETIWELSLHTLELAAREISRVDLESKAVMVNLSPVALGRSDLAHSVASVLDRTGLTVDHVGIEITERAVATGEPAIMEGLEQLRKLGVGYLAIDDFGVGLSSLGRLARLPIDTLKIDRALIAELGHEEGDRIVKGIIELAHSIDLIVVAEGVEDRPTADWLTGSACDAMQGFYLAKPAPLDDLQTARAAHSV